MSLHVAIAKQIAADIEAGGVGAFGVALTPVVSCADFDWPLEEADSLRCDVVPADIRSGKETRATLTYETQTTVLLRYKFAATERESDSKFDVDTVDEYIAILHRIHEYFWNRSLSGIASLIWNPENSQIRAQFSSKMLREHGQYSGWLTIGYDKTREPNT